MSGYRIEWSDLHIHLLVLLFSWYLPFTCTAPGTVQVNEEFSTIVSHALVGERDSLHSITRTEVCDRTISPSARQ